MAENVKTYLRGTKKVARVSKLTANPLVICRWKNSWVLTAALLAQLRERRPAEPEVAGSKPGRTNTQGLVVLVGRKRTQRQSSLLNQRD